MAIMDEEFLDPIVRDAIIDRFEGWELVEFLDISIERIVELLTEEIIENIDDVKWVLRMESDDNDQD